MLKKHVAGILAILLGIFGTHHFYVGNKKLGVLQCALFFFALFASVSGAPEELLGFVWPVAAIIPVITGVVWMAMPQAKWDAKFNKEYVGDDYSSKSGGGYTGRASGTELKAEGIRYYKSADYDLALEAFAEAIGADYADPGSHFNLACSYAQLGRYPDAMRHLEISVTLGLPKPERIEKHPALGAMRRLPAFQEFRQNNYRQQRLVTGNTTSTAARGVSANPSASSATGPSVQSSTTAPTPPPPHEANSNPIPPAPAAAPKKDRNGIDVNGDLLDQISRLRELHDAGILTPREYQLQKERLLG
ncbi:NINE protein [Lewinella sp. 4G2]|uniref:NINE protein n=1 Tax=Lewinella sp. 4G2 TaxID=1803372 RepID=UPI0007B4A211|nr:NINE protein [Lewinella sp. 4G2]OAV44647.1 hypothetical protein A3850_009150 [Lewinella sp. 4G2]